MPNSDLIDVALGLTFVFVLFSILVSAANEMIVALFKSRAAALWDAIGELLNGDDALRKAFYDHSLVASVKPPHSWGGTLTDRRLGPSYIEPRTFASVLLDILKEPHAVLGRIENELLRTTAELRMGDVSGLARASSALASLASQLPDSADSNAIKSDLLRLRATLDDRSKSVTDFATALHEVLHLLPLRWRAALEASAKDRSPGFEKTIRALTSNAAGSIERLRVGIEQWFDEGMGRASGWYKRWTQAVQFSLGLVLAIALNVDAIQIVRALDANSELRRSVSAQALAMAQQETLDPRNVTAGASSGSIGLSLESTDSQEFKLAFQLGDVQPQPGSFSVALEPSDLAVVLTCGEARPESESVSLTCQVRGIRERTEATVVGSFTDATSQQRQQASMPVVFVPDGEAQYEAMVARLSDTKLPLGWEGDSKRYFRDNVIWAVFGWLITALAASLGAPFWFDLLKKAANLRSSGPNPSETPAAQRNRVGEIALSIER